MQRTLSTIVVTLIVGLMPSAACAGDQPANEAKQLLLKSRAAIRQAKVVSYQAEYGATGYIKKWVKDVRGKVLVGEKAKYEVPRFLLDITMPGDEDAEPDHYTVGCNGDEYFLVDAKTKTVYVDLDPAVLGSNSRAFQRVILPEFGDENAFEDELEAEHLELGEAESVAGEDCAVVRVKNESPPDIVWWISQKDHLPRRVRRLYKDDEDGEGTTELTLSALVVNPKVTDAPFRVRVPDGFKKTDDFAP